MLEHQVRWHSKGRGKFLEPILSSQALDHWLLGKSRTPVSDLALKNETIILLVLFSLRRMPRIITIKFGLNGVPALFSCRWGSWRAGPWCPLCDPMDCSTPRSPCPSPTPGVHHPIISSSVVPFPSCPQSSQHQGLFKWISSSHQVAKILEFQVWID